MRDNREWRFQAFVDRLLDRIVLPPMFTSGVDHAGQRSMVSRVRMAGRGIKALPDVYVAQFPGCTNGLSAWLELKRGSRVSPAQEGVHTAMKRAGVHVSVCSTMAEVVASLRDAGFALHGNADNLAAEYEERASVAPAKKASKPRAAKPPASRIARAHKAGIWSAPEHPEDARVRAYFKEPEA